MKLMRRHFHNIRILNHFFETIIILIITIRIRILIIILILIKSIVIIIILINNNDISNKFNPAFLISAIN